MKFAALIALALMSAPAFAQAPYPPQGSQYPPPAERGRPYPPRHDSREFGVYFGGGVGGLSYDMDGAVTNPAFGTFQLRGGVIINKYLSVAGQVSFAHTDYEWDEADDPREYYDTEDFHLNNASEIYLQPRIPLGNVGFYGRLGWMESEVEAFNNKISAEGPAYGIGVDVDFGRLTIAADVTAYDLDFDLAGATNTGRGGSFAITLANRF